MNIFIATAKIFDNSCYLSDQSHAVIHNNLLFLPKRNYLTTQVAKMFIAGR